MPSLQHPNLVRVIRVTHWAESCLRQRQPVRLHVFHQHCWILKVLASYRHLDQTAPATPPFSYNNNNNNTLPALPHTPSLSQFGQPLCLYLHTSA